MTARSYNVAVMTKVTVIEKVVRETPRKKALGELFTALDEIQAAKLPPMTEEKIRLTNR